MGRFNKFGYELYEGTRSVNFVGRRWLWYGISIVLILLALGGFLGRGLHMSLEFTGGTSYTVTTDGDATQDVADQLREAIGAAGVDGAEDPVVTTSGQDNYIVQVKSLPQDDATAIEGVIQEITGADADSISQTSIGASWGSEIAKKAIIGLVIFLILVVLLIWVFFREWKMSVAALVALAHDVVITVGIYALSGFEVSPATVTGFLTILGFSLYDTVIVFGKVRENTQGLKTGKRTYAQAANLAANQTLVRSINTSVVALIPVAAILYVSTVQLGASTLKDLALALFVGMAVGAYSSIFLATPLLVHLKEGEKEVQQADRRAKARVRHSADPYAHVPTGPVSGATGEDELRG